MHENELYHHGVKGQRWGIRRFQNKDGSLTRLGVARLGQKSSGNSSKPSKPISDSGSNRGAYSLATKFDSIAGGSSSRSGKSGLLDKASGLAAIGIGAAAAGAMFKGGKTNKDALFTGGKKGSPAEKMLNSTKNITDSLGKGIDSRANKRAAKEAAKIDLSNASDQEIREYVNRYNLEKQFRQITAEQYSSGSSKTKAIVETVGTVASVGASIAAIVVAYNQIKNGNVGG